MLVVSLAGGMPAQEIRRLAALDELPDKILAEEAYGAREIDDMALAALGGVRGRLLGALPASLAVAIMAWARRGEFDVMLSWSERSAFPLAMLLALTPRRRTRHIAVLMWPFNESSPSRARRAAKRVVYRLLARHGVAVPSGQYAEALIEPAA